MGSGISQKPPVSGVFERAPCRETSAPCLKDRPPRLLPKKICPALEIVVADGLTLTKTASGDRGNAAANMQYFDDVWNRNTNVVRLRHVLAHSA